MTNEQSPDDAYIELAIEAADNSGVTIPNVAARMIASQYHDGATSAMYSLASCGALDVDRLAAEITRTYAEPKMELPELRKLHHLAMYAAEHGNRGPVEGWHQLWGRVVRGGDV